MKKSDEDHEVSFSSNSGWRISKKLAILLAAIGALSCLAVGLIVYYVGVSNMTCEIGQESSQVLGEKPSDKPTDSAKPSKVHFVFVELLNQDSSTASLFHIKIIKNNIYFSNKKL